MTCDSGAEVVGWDVYGFTYCLACSPTNQEQSNEAGTPLVVAIWNDDEGYPPDVRCAMCGAYLKGQKGGNP